ncbi:hypothetical protein [Flavivirga sp. 57AJ16]|uniref:hypothetical protein n=1 Tax=Flavivirga sp. 57AJ16 TaxID=3025307 RepID=UPI00308239DB
MKYVVLVMVLCLFASCSNDDEKDYTALNDKEITDYIAENNLVAKKVKQDSIM